MVDGDHQTGLAAVLGHGLHAFPKIAQETVELVGRSQIPLVVPFMGPIVGLTIRNVEGARFDCIDCMKRGIPHKGVQQDPRPQRLARADHFIQGPRHRHPAGSWWHVETAPNRKTRPGPIQDPWQDIPIDHRRDLAPVTRPGVEPLEDVGVGIEELVVAVDFRISNAGQEFVVAGVGEVAPVGHPDLGTAFSIAQQLPVLGHRAPKEWEEHFTALLGIRAPELRLEFIGLTDVAILFGDEDFISALEHLFLSQAIGGDEDHMACLVARLGRPRLGRQQKRHRAQHAQHGADTETARGSESRQGENDHNDRKTDHTAPPGQPTLRPSTQGWHRAPSQYGSKNAWDPVDYFHLGTGGSGP